MHWLRTTTVFNHLVLTRFKCLRHRHLRTLRNHTFTHRASPRLRTLQAPTFRIIFMIGVCPTRHLRTTIVATRTFASVCLTLLTNLALNIPWNNTNMAAHTKIIRMTSLTVRAVAGFRLICTRTRVRWCVLSSTTLTALTGTETIHVHELKVSQERCLKNYRRFEPANSAEWKRFPQYVSDRVTRATYKHLISTLRTAPQKCILTQSPADHST